MNARRATRGFRLVATAAVGGALLVSTVGTLGAVAANSGKARAAALVKKYSPVPSAKSIVGVTPFTKRPPTGKTIAYINCGVAPCSTKFSPGIHAAAAVLGWTAKDYNYTPANPVTLQSAIQSAINDNVTAIVATAGQPTVTITGQKAAKAKGIIWINGFGAGTWKATTTVTAGLFYGPVEGQFDGTLMAAYLAQQSAKGPVHTALLRVKAFDSVHLPKIVGLKKGLATMCKACTYTEITESAEQQIGNQSSSVVVSYLQAHPTINYIIFESGQPAAGIQAALATAGLSSKVKVVGFAPTDPQISSVAKGTEDMWVYECDTCAGWYFADAAALILAKKPVTTITSVPLPTQVATKQSVPATPPIPYAFPTTSQLKAKFSAIWRIAS